jgi:hypothetical protein
MPAFPYTPGTRPANPGPLASYLPPIEEGTITAWLLEHVPRHAWLLDPFGISPRLAVEVARAGYRLLVTANNPITRFLLEVTAAAPSEAGLKAALAELAASRKGEERLETHLQSLYLTPCASCGKEISAQAFLWHKGEDTPYARIYTCPHCQDSGERPATSADAQRAIQIARTIGLHRARVLERVAPLDDPDRQYAEEALQVYLPRPLYVLATLINRLDGLITSPERRRWITALILAACEMGTSLHSDERPRPKSLSISNQFREPNLWLALEAAIAQFRETGSAVPCEAWPHRIPESGGICLFEGRLKTLAAQVSKEIPISAVVTVLPRPNQAFWTLSALWAGWLWGREAVEPFKVALRRRRYDWGWNATALTAAFQHLANLLPPHTPVFTLLAEVEPPFLTSAMLAASTAGFELDGLAMRTAHDPIQILWRRGVHPPSVALKPDPEAVHRALSHFLAERGEPATYLHLHAAALSALSEAHALKDPAADMDEALRQIQSLMQRLLPAHFEHYSLGEGIESGLWGLAENDSLSRQESLADRVEIETVKFLQKHPDSIYLDIEAALYARFPGLQTPSKGLIYQVLNAYAIKNGGAYRLRPEDAPAARRAELAEMRQRLKKIGQRLGYSLREEEEAVLWEEDGEVKSAFYVLASALLWRVVRASHYPPERCFLVLPGGRAALAAYKQQRDPALARRLRGWRMLKFRLLRALTEIPILTRSTFEEQIAADPVEQATEQLMMF